MNASGAAVGTPFVLPVQSDRTITVALPEAQFGTPGSGWGFTVVLTGQDGFSPDQARAFTATPGAFTFGVCAAGDTEPICSVDPDDRAEGHGRHHAGGRLAGHRAQPHARPGRHPAGDRAVGSRRDN